jgi:hypothetical protein
MVLLRAVGFGRDAISGAASRDWIEDHGQAVV